jgi:hypothetical protein
MRYIHPQAADLKAGMKLFESSLVITERKEWVQCGDGGGQVPSGFRQACTPETPSISVIDRQKSEDLFHAKSIS